MASERAGELVVMGGTDLMMRREPEAVLAEAQKAAKALTDVISKKSRPVKFNGETYLEFEDWQTVGAFFGITAKVESTAFVNYDGIKGFSCRAIAVNREGVEMSAAESECLDDEERWRDRPKYQDGEKVGTERVPLFQVKSMAQTRACAKVLRNVLSWVVVLAGYRPTPAEELEGTGTHVREHKSAGSGSTSKEGEKSSQATADGPTKVVGEITEKRGTKDGKEWIKYSIPFEDGRKASTFDKKIRDAAIEARDAGAIVNPKLKTTTYGTDIIGWNPVEVPAAAASGEPEQTDEKDPDVTTSEKILTVREVEVADGDGKKEKRWIINTEKRTVVADVEAWAEAARAARAEGTGLTPDVEQRPRKHGKGTYNHLKAWRELTEAGIDTPKT